MSNLIVPLNSEDANCIETLPFQRDRINALLECMLRTPLGKREDGRTPYLSPVGATRGLLRGLGPIQPSDWS